MDTITTRANQAEHLWQQGREAEQRRDFRRAYALYTEAHNLIMDCARLHQHAHTHLRRVNWKLGNYGELTTDWLLHLFAPLGVFELVSYFAKTDARFAEMCRRVR